MALISTFKLKSLERMSLHKPIEAEIATYELDGRKLLQLDTKGSADRKIPGKVSQSIQLDENAARELVDIVNKHFGF